jgi:hypothetical protein
MGALDIDVKVEEVDESDEGQDQEDIDEGLEGEAEGGGAARFFEPVGDPLVDGPEEEEEDEAGDPGADDAAGFDGGREDVGVEEADARHEEGAEKGEEDLSACLFGFSREYGGQRDEFYLRRYKKMTREVPGQTGERLLKKVLTWLAISEFLRRPTS